MDVIHLYMLLPPKSERLTSAAYYAHRVTCKHVAADSWQADVLSASHWTVVTCKTYGREVTHQRHHSKHHHHKSPVDHASSSYGAYCARLST